VTLAYRRVRDETKKRPVALIVICDACGNREIGWAWHDGGGLHWWAAEVPYLDSQDGWFRRFHAKRSTSASGETSNPVLPDDWDWVRLRARCPHHGDLVTPEIDRTDLVPTSTRRIRAFPSTAQ
jgi:hypothetical protein